MTANLTWHIPESALRAYVRGGVGDVDAWSVESHLSACERCRIALADVSAADPDHAAAINGTWAVLAAELPEQGRPRPATRLRAARVLVAGGPAARWAWLAACGMVLVFAAVLSVTSATHVPWLGIVAPLVPLLGVAASFGSGLDDAYEVIASTPAGGLRLLLVRSAAVLAVTTPIALVAGAVTGYGSPAPWLLASLALTLATLALGSAVGVERAAAVVGIAWVVAVGGAVANPTAPLPVLLTLDAAPVLLAAIALGGVVIAARRAEFNHVPIRHRTRIEAVQ